METPPDFHNRNAGNTSLRPDVRPPSTVSVAIRTPDGFPPAPQKPFPTKRGTAHTPSPDTVSPDPASPPFRADVLYAPLAPRFSCRSIGENSACVWVSSIHHSTAVCRSCCCSWLPGLPTLAIAVPKFQMPETTHSPRPPLHLPLLRQWLASLLRSECVKSVQPKFRWLSRF